MLPLEIVRDIAYYEQNYLTVQAKRINKMTKLLI